MDKTTKETIRRAVAAGVCLCAAEAASFLRELAETCGYDPGLALSRAKPRLAVLMQGIDVYKGIDTGAPRREVLAVADIKTTVVHGIASDVPGTHGFGWPRPIWEVAAPLMHAVLTAGEECMDEYALDLQAVLDMDDNVSVEDGSWQAAMRWVRELRPLVDKWGQEEPESAPAEEHAQSENEVGDSAGVDIAELERTTPPLDVESGEWIAAADVAMKEGQPALESLKKYRSTSMGGHTTGTGEFGVDRQGRVWRRGPDKRIYYRVSTL